MPPNLHFVVLMEDRISIDKIWSISLLWMEGSRSVKEKAAHYSFSHPSPRDWSQLSISECQNILWRRPSYGNRKKVFLNQELYFRKISPIKVHPNILSHCHSLWTYNSWRMDEGEMKPCRTWQGRHHVMTREVDPGLQCPGGLDKHL